MPLLLDSAPSQSAVALRGADGLTIGLINSMPDAAVEATERQFVELLREAAPDAVIRLKLFHMTGVPRSERSRAELAGRYRDIGELWDTHLDGLIVTGTEPRAADLREEPHWATLSKLVDWAGKNTASTIWSCLAAHAAVLHLDGIERRRLAEKKFGVFTCETVSAHPLLKNAAPQLRVPHSRHNDLPEAALAACGYRLLSRSSAAGVDMFVQDEGPFSLFLFLQGHPEYEASTLLREYRRDVGRFLRGERADYPAMPRGYFNPAASALAKRFRTRALREPRDGLIADFPTAVLAAGLERDWRRSAVSLYRSWVAHLKERKAEQRSPAVLMRRSG